MAGNDGSTWPQPDFDTDPRLLIGYQAAGSRRPRGGRVRLHEDTFAELAAFCAPALERLDSMAPRRWEPTAELESGEEYFVVDVRGLPNREPPLRQRSQPDDSPPNDDGTADLVGLVRNVDEMPELAAGSIRERNYSFYAVCWSNGDDLIAFIRRANPTSSLRPGNRYFQFGDALRKVEQPDLVLDGQIDMIMSGNQLAVFNQQAFNTLLADIGIALTAVPANIKSVSNALAKKVPLSDRAAAALGEFAGTRVSIARRLQTLPSRLEQIALTPEGFKAVSEERSIDPNQFVDGDGKFSFDASVIPTFLDLLEGRLFDDVLGTEKRRADRWSTR